MQAFEKRCYQRLLNSYSKDQVTNEEVLGNIQAAICEFNELLALVNKRKIIWFTNISRYSIFEKKNPLEHSQKKKVENIDKKEVGIQYQRADRNGICQVNQGD